MLAHWLRYGGSMITRPWDDYTPSSQLPGCTKQPSIWVFLNFAYLSFEPT